MTVKILVQTKKETGHEALALMFMFFATFIPVIMCGLALQLLTDNSASANATSITETVYFLSITVLIGFTAYWFILLGGVWIKQWLKVR